jgi:hypothetical protein
MRSERLRYEPVTPAALDVFHTLVQDEHVRRYLMDGKVMPREWSEDLPSRREALLRGDPKDPQRPTHFVRDDEERLTIRA